MSKEWVLNSAMNRFQLNFKRNVGAVSDEIRKCSPKTVDEWKDYYYNKVYPEAHIEELGQKLYTKITEVLVAEIDDVTEEDCVRYMKQVVIDRTFDGYQTEIQTVYGQLQGALGVKIEPAPDEWDRLFNVDFFIEVNGRYIGLQIKPVNNTQLAEIFKERNIQLDSHDRFSKDQGGPVFYIFSVKQGDKKVIANPQVIDEIRQAIERYKAQPG